jgi:hypothetical protein
MLDSSPGTTTDCVGRGSWALNLRVRDIPHPVAPGFPSAGGGQAPCLLVLAGRSRSGRRQPVLRSGISLAEQEAEGTEIQPFIESVYPPDGLRAKILARLDT